MASLEVALHWQSGDATHIDRHFFDRINFWRDFFPRDLGDRLAQAEVGVPVSTAVAEGELVEAYSPSQVRAIKPSQFTRALPNGMVIEPRPGRFYPRSLISGVDSHFSGDRRACRCLDSTGSELVFDFNHPFARFPAVVEAHVVEVLESREERGGVCNDIPEILTRNGPGMQASLPDRETDFFSGEPFTRMDARDDALFYNQPRIVHHLDSLAISRIESIYARFIDPGMKVLDLMSSWVSHVPDSLQEVSVTGLGLNQEELSQNPRLSAAVVHDLNNEPRLPFADAEFDAVICTVSVEYLVRPVEVFTEVARVLKPGSPFVLSFSDRWFPPKAIRLWTELHPFERLGLVLEYFRNSRQFDSLSTESIRGLPRPADDKYAEQLSTSDPVFAVWGRKT